MKEIAIKAIKNQEYYLDVLKAIQDLWGARQNSPEGELCKSSAKSGQLLYITSSIYFQSAAVNGRRNTNSQPP